MMAAALRLSFDTLMMMMMMMMMKYQVFMKGCLEVCVKWHGITFVSKFNLTHCEGPKVCNFVFPQSVTCEQTCPDIEISISMMTEHLQVTAKDTISLVVLHTQAEIFFNW